MGFLVKRQPDRPGRSKMVPHSPPFSTLFTRRGVPFSKMFAPARLHTIGSALTGVIGTNSNDTFTKTSHGLPNGANVVLSALTGGTGLTQYLKSGLFVVNTAANTFQLALAPGGTPVDLGSDVSALTVQRVGSAAPIR
jgi:hypothetical protein